VGTWTTSNGFAAATNRSVGQDRTRRDDRQRRTPHDQIMGV